MKIWQRYLFRQISTTFLFILFSLFTVYLFIDLSVHSIRFIQNGCKIDELLLYYAQALSSHLTLFIPLAFLLASLKVLSDLTTHLELLSLQMARLSMKKILTPFFLLAGLLTAISYANFEWMPQKTVKPRSKQVQMIILPDNTELVYHHLDRKKKELSDVFWVRSATDFWHIKTLSFKNKPPTAFFADHLVSQEGKLVKQESFDRKIFKDIILKGKVAPTVFQPAESRPLSDLWRDSSHQSKIQTHLHHKLATPLLPFLILLSLAPFTLIHTRTRRTFLIASISLLAFITVLILFNSLIVLGVNQMIEPWIAMWIVPALIFILSIRKFARL